MDLGDEDDMTKLGAGSRTQMMTKADGEGHRSPSGVDDRSLTYVSSLSVLSLISVKESAAHRHLTLRPAQSFQSTLHIHLEHSPTSLATWNLQPTMNGLSSSWLTKTFLWSPQRSSQSCTDARGVGLQDCDGQRTPGATRKSAEVRRVSTEVEGAASQAPAPGTLHRLKWRRPQGVSPHRSWRSGWLLPRTGRAVRTR